MTVITNGTYTFTVTDGAYKSMYAPQGWIIVGVPKSSKMVLNGNSDLGDNLSEHESENTTETIFDQENEESAEIKNEDMVLDEIPLSEMDSAQLRAYAKKLGVDITGMTSKKAVRDKIRAAL